MHFLDVTVALLSTLSLAAASAIPSNEHVNRVLARATTEQLTNLRIEGATDTIYEAPIISGPHNVTTPSAGTHPCTGTNNGANPKPGNTPTDALDVASKLANFKFDGTFDTEFDDFFITSIGDSAQTATEYWGLLINYQYTPVGGCQCETNQGDEVLWAYNAFNMVYFLKVEPAYSVVKPGGTLQVTVTDGMSGVPIEGATIDGVVTDVNGHATLTMPEAGLYEYKATKQDCLRSNAIVVAV